MKKITTMLVFALVALCAAISVQASYKDDWKQKMMSEKIAFLSAELNLTPEEAQAFWPVYNQVCEEHDKAMGEMFRVQKAMRKAIEEGKPQSEIASLLAKFLDAQAKQAEIMKASAEKYKKAIPVEKVAKLYISEEKFRRQCIHRMHGKPSPDKKTLN